jgi:uncharacterized protein (TIGR00369 family)
VTNIRERIAASFNAQGLMKTLGATLELVTDGEVHIALPFSTRLSQQQGFVHAGAIASIVDSACGYAALTKLPIDKDVVSVEFKINLTRPAIGERFLAIGRVQTAGRMLTVCTGEVRAFAASTEAHRVVALIQATMATVEMTSNNRGTGP